MRHLGLIGGTTYHSTIEYYRSINQMVAEHTGNTDWARLTLDSLNFGELTRNNRAGRSDLNEAIVMASAVRLRNAGVEGLALCANTLHMFRDAIYREVNLPIIHIAEATRSEILKQRLSKVALLGTRFTMTRNVYHSMLHAQGVECITPEEPDATAVDASIFGELARGEFTPELRQFYSEVIQRLIERGAEGVILGCTEIPLLLKPEDIAVPSFDTIQLHCRAIADFILQPEA